MWTYSVIYVFRLDGVVPPTVADASNWVVWTPSQSYVTISAESPLAGGFVFANFQRRSAKCLYPWRCGWQWGGVDHSFYRV
jgi:hypothetical protein